MIVGHGQAPPRRSMSGRCLWMLHAKFGRLRARADQLAAAPCIKACFGANLATVLHEVQGLGQEWIEACLCVC